MNISKSSLIIKRPVTIKAIVTPKWKEEVEMQFQNQISQIDEQKKQLELQGKRAITELQRQNLTSPNLQISQQIESIQMQVNQKGNELLQNKNQLLQQLEQVQLLEMEDEVAQGQMESLVKIEKGDNLVQKMNVEIVMRDGIVQEIRGEV